MTTLARLIAALSGCAFGEACYRLAFASQAHPWFALGLSLCALSVCVHLARI
jgi:hypothetical protein